MIVRPGFPSLYRQDKYTIDPLIYITCLYGNDNNCIQEFNVVQLSRILIIVIVRHNAISSCMESLLTTYIEIEGTVIYVNKTVLIND